MYCFKIDIPEEVSKIDDELKATHQSSYTGWISVFKTRNERNNLVDETAGMIKVKRESRYDNYYNLKVTYNFFIISYQWRTDLARLS